MHISGNKHGLSTTSSDNSGGGASGNDSWGECEKDPFRTSGFKMKSLIYHLPKKSYEVRGRKGDRLLHFFIKQNQLEKLISKTSPRWHECH